MRYPLDGVGLDGKEKVCGSIPFELGPDSVSADGLHHQDLRAGPRR